MSKAAEDRGILLIVDDEPDMLPLLKRTISAEVPWEILTALSAEEALKDMECRSVDLLLLDIKMPGMDGMELLSLLRERVDAPTVVMMTAYGVIDLAVEAIRKGAYDFITKPLDDTRLLLTLQKAMEYHRLLHENRNLQRLLKGKGMFQDMVGASPAMQRVYETIRMVAGTDATVLITGESGTGKELVARAIHRRSPRAEKEFVPVNCPALPEHILETELFGYVKGAFTDAKTDKRGLFQEADGGTLFLDEIGDLPINLQTKLLRVLQEKEVRPLGSSKRHVVDVRVLASTNRNIKEEMARERFREDLYYRLNVISVHLPPLRERPEDIPLLAEHLLQRYAAESDKEELRFGPGLLEELGRMEWPGNVRELENAIRRAIILCRGSAITSADLGPEFEEKCLVTGTLRDLPYREAKRQVLDTFNREFLSCLLAENQGNVTHAARKCGLERQAFQQLLRRYGIHSENYRNHP
ncbi:MAG: sigma-54-dependent Fis family transcriptional regulator [Deltaproteobacteria bacterium]|nr:sigma-54-dependent Fis family transcriptional regulator [Deltaproteobacteria bacterium]